MSDFKNSRSMHLDTPLLQEQARQSFQNAQPAMLAHLFIVGVFYLLFNDFLDPGLLAIWSVVISSLAISRFILFLQYKKKKPKNIRPWLHSFTFITLLIGISWACFSLFYLTTDDAHLQTIVIVLSCGVMAAAVPVLAAWTPAFYANTFPQLITILSILLYSDSSTAHYLAYSLVIYYAMLISLQRNANETIRNGFQLQHHNDQLVSDLNSEVERREQIIERRTQLLDENVKRLDFALSSARQGWFDVDIQTGKILVSDEYPLLLGFKPANFHPTLQMWHENIHPDDLESVLNVWQECLGTGNTKEVEYRIKTRNGRWLWFHSMGGITLSDKNNKPHRMIGIHMDITDRKEAQQSLTASETRYRALFNSTHDAVMILNEGKFIDGNKAALMLLGCTTLKLLLTHKLTDFLPEKQACGTSSIALAKQQIAIAHEKGSLHFEWLHKRLDTNDTFPADVLLSAVNINGEKLIQATVRDITEEKYQQERLHLMAHYDPLTDLPNRTLFADRFRQAVAHSNRTESMLAICFLDLDNFKPVNDNYGHDVGDQLLIEVAKRIKDEVREEDTISRQGGDEFTLLLRDIDSFNQCEQLLERIRRSLAEPYLINDSSHKISVSIGTTIYPLDDSDLDTLLRHADQAMYQAKLSGRNQHRLFDALTNQEITQQQTQQQEIKQALTNEEFQLYYQPKVNMQTGKVYGVEALIRWFHPEKGMIPPLDFLPLIEGNEIEIQVGGWVINEAIQQLDNWQQQGIDFEMSINVSSYHLQSSIFFVQINGALEQFPNVKPQNLQLEILESSALGDIEAIGNIINNCQNVLGINVALDDFGTGYSSLAHLRNLSANIIKIDQTFVRDMLDDNDDLALIEGIISLANVFDRQVIAEGVETAEHGVLLMRIGCDCAQGYGIAKPMPANKIINWLQNYKPDASWSVWAGSEWEMSNLPLVVAQYDHIKWIQQIFNALEGFDLGLRHEELTNHTECRLGHWYYDHGKKHYGHLEAFRELEAIHTDVHATGHQIIELYNDGRKAEAVLLAEQLLILKSKVLDTLNILQKQVNFSDNKS